MNDCILSDDTVLGRIRLNDFEFHWPHAATHEESVTLSDRPVSLQEVRLDVNLEDVAAETFNGIVEIGLDVKLEDGAAETFNGIVER